VVSFPLAFPPIIYTRPSSPHSCYMPRPSHSLRLDYSNYTWRRVQITKLLVMQFSPFSCHLIPLRSKYSPECTTTTTNNNNSNNNNYNYNTIIIYLCANLTIKRSITKWTRVKKRNETQTRYNNKSVYTIIIIIIITTITATCTHDLHMHWVLTHRVL
jgi:hypothetical protein